MKGIKKYLFIMAALAAIFGFVACSDDDDDDNNGGGGSSSGNAVAVYKGDYAYNTYTVSFFGDGSFTIVGESQLADKSKVDIGAGTYTGDPSRDGEITLEFSKYVGNDSGNMDNMGLGSLLNGKHTIENGKCTIGGITYTRQ